MKPLEEKQLSTCSSATDPRELPKFRLIDLVQNLLARGRVDDAIYYQIEIPLMLGLPFSEAMEKTLDEITEFFDSITPPPLPGYDNFWWGPAA